jgi:hypothetical protein
MLAVMFVQSTTRVAARHEVAFSFNSHFKLWIFAVLANHVLGDELIQVLQHDIVRMQTFDERVFFHVGSKLSAEKFHHS